jgi:hypothetical protein
MVSINIDEKTEPFSQFTSDFAMEQRSCMSAQIGYDYLHTNIEKMVQQYLDLYNDRWNGKRQTFQKIKTWRDHLFKENMHFKIEPLEVPADAKYGELTGKREVNKNAQGSRLEVSVPVKVSTREGNVQATFKTSLIIAIQEHSKKISNINS